MEPTYLLDPLFPVCRDICPTWTQNTASFVDTECLRTCSYALAQWGATQDSKTELLSLISQAYGMNGDAQISKRS